eukprot:9240702-Prorocentrum_lima.AAC.1
MTPRGYVPRTIDRFDKDAKRNIPRQTVRSRSMEVRAPSSLPIRETVVPTAEESSAEISSKATADF